VSINAIGEARASGWFVDTTGHVWSVGEGKYCDSKESDVPREVSKLSNVVEVQGGEQHVLFRLGDGHVMACGINAAGELGLPSSVKRRFRPVEVPGLSEVVEVSAGQRQSLARTASGKVYAFGSNAEGQVCMPSSVKHLFTPTEVPLPGRASHISAGGNFVTDGHSFIMVEGVPYGCGDDASGQLGDGKTTNKYAPTVATELLRYEPKAVIAAGETSIGLFGDGEVMTWGSANEGSLGNGSEEGFSLAPFRVDSGAVEVSGTAFDMLYRK
jgi:alpha-tubulin suppressor-like RCC1 family protein